MKYKLVEVNPTGCSCGKSYSLVEDTDGYDLIQLKRGLQAAAGNLILQPGEPAFVLDTGKLYIGNAAGVPVLINGGGGGGSASLAVIGDYEDGALIEVPYNKMITASGSAPTAADAGNYLILSVLDSNKKPIGEAVLTNWNFTATSAQFRYGSYIAAVSVSKIVHTQVAAAASWSVSAAEVSDERVISVRVRDTDGNLIYPDWRVNGTTIEILFQTPTAGDAVIYLN